ncbi:MAG: LAGLIDADG family homing endonuclease, partial [Candidatus Subteraquimicrobiales bacterium]|nr:LAGLIDADG family homing endonuclease [Candidatus Subteraquimicrobiales bacterium]
TPEGRKKINAILGGDNKIKGKMNKPQLVSILSDMAKEDANKTSGVVDRLIRLGDDYAYETGFSYGLSDLEPLTELRKGVLADLRKDIKHLKSKDPNELQALYKEYSDKSSKAIAEIYENSDNPIGDVLLSKARGSASQVMDTVFTPIAVNAAEVISKPIAHSYIEGLTPSEYFAASAGARAGVIGKSQGTAKPGALGKILFTTTNNLVINKDKGESMGVIKLPVSNVGDLLDRYIGEDVYSSGELLIEKGTLIEPRIVMLARKRRIKELPVYSPLMSSSADGGIPAMSYGVVKGGHNPEVGYNIGAHAAAGIVSPLYTESMQSFHCFHGDVSVYTIEGHLKTIENLHRENYSGYILDIENKFVKVLNTWEHEVSDNMALAKTKDGHSLISQYNHPMQIGANTFVCQYCGGSMSAGKRDSYRCNVCTRSSHPVVNTDTQSASTREITKDDAGKSTLFIQKFPINFGTVKWDWDLHPYMMGAHIAEGSYNVRANTAHNDGLHWSQSPGTAIYDKYHTLLKGTNKGKLFSLTNQSLHERMILETGRYSHQRRLPFNILNYSRYDVLNLLAGIIDGDGTVVRFPGAGRRSGFDNIVVDSTSYALVSQLQILGSSLGYHSIVFPTKYKSLSLWQPFRVSFKLNKPQKEELSAYSIKASTLNRVGKRNGFNDPGTIKSVNDTRYNHPNVYDVKTESGTFIGNELWVHNTGSSLQDRDSGYNRLKQVLELTKAIANKATLSKKDGIVSDIKEDSLGGHTVTIDGAEHYVSPSNKVTVRTGKKVERGEPLSDGPIDPRDIADLKDLSAAQKYMVEEIVKNTPTHIKRRAAEVVVESITRHGQVFDPGDSEYLPGDIKLISEMEHRNKSLDKKIKYDVVFKGVNTLPLSSQSWMAQLNFRNMGKVLNNAIATGAESDIHSYEPAPALAWGTEFGEGENGKY